MKTFFSDEKFYLPGLFFLMGLVALLCLFLGPTHSLDSFILTEVRLPRVILGMLVGISLAVVGTMFQSLLRNPLADPYVLGTSSGASLGALLGLHLKNYFPQGGLFLFYLCIFCGAFGATLLSYAIARSKKQVPITNLVLAGVIVSTLCGAVIMLIFSLQQHDSFSIFFFLMGSLQEASWKTIAISSLVSAFSIALSYCYSKDLDILSLGEEKAFSLGINVEKLKYILFGLGSLMVSATVALAGSIGFVGLVVPHIARLMVGPRNKILIVVSAFLGTIILMLADALARTVFRPIEIPVGIIMALLGAPFFLWLLKRKGKVDD